MTNEGEVLEGSTVDSHMMKNIEWGAVAILSQSKYGVFNPESSTGANGDKTYQVWNNPSSSHITGSVEMHIIQQMDQKQVQQELYMEYMIWQEEVGNMAGRMFKWTRKC